MTTWLKSFLEESPGVGSSSRLILLLAFVACVLAPVAYVLVTREKLDPDVLNYCKFTFIASLTGKVGQSVFGEKTTPTP